MRRLTASPPDAVDFSSNDYLSISSNPDIQKSVLSRLEARATGIDSNGGILGSRGSRLLDGNSYFVEALERKIANFHIAPSALLFQLGIRRECRSSQPAFPQPGDIVLYDEAIHASIHDGMRG